MRWKRRSSILARKKWL